MNWPTRGIDICLTSCECLTGAKCSSWLTARALLRTQGRRATIFSETKTTGSVTTVIWAVCLIPKSGQRSRPASKSCATQLCAIPNLNRRFLLTTESNAPRLRSRKTRRCITTSNRNGRSPSVTADHERSPEVFSNMRGF